MVARSARGTRLLNPCFGPICISGRCPLSGYADNKIFVLGEASASYFYAFRGGYLLGIFICYAVGITIGGEAYG